MAQIDDPGAETAPKPSYMLQDANFNVMALVKFPETGGPVVLSQYQYEPYGPVAAEDHDAGVNNANENVAGHQGLFFHRLSVGGLSLAPGTQGIYYNRNRWYAPHLGRFLTRDPNATAQVLISTVAMNGQAATALTEAINLHSHFRDGVNLYASRRAGPVNSRDPLGLSSWENDIENAMAGVTGQKLYALGAINEGAKIASIGLQTAVKIAGSLLPGSGLYDAFKSVQVVASGKGGFWEAMNIAMAAMPLAKGVSAILGMKSLMKAGRYAKQACNCFVAGTSVSTPKGSVPIETIQEGDEVLTRHQDRPGDLTKSGRVTRSFRSIAPVIVWLTLSTGDVMGTTLGHEVWTHQGGWTLVNEIQAGDTLMGTDGQAVTIAGIRLDSIPTPVYNLEVDGTFTYFAQNVWVHNNSCSLVRHHLMPRQFRSQFSRAGLDIDDFTIPIPGGDHMDLHGRGGTIADSWNGQWQQFFDTNPNATQQEILAEYGELVARFLGTYGD